MGIDTLYQDYRREDGKASLPMSHVSLDITYRCNNRCNMCFLYGDHLSENNPVLKTIHTRRELTIPEWKDVLSELSEIGVRGLVMTGGEVFMKKGFTELVEFAKQEKGFYVSILSNGSFITPDIAGELVSIRPDFMRFSLDGDKDAHDRICGVSNYDFVIEAIRMLVEAKRKCNVELPALGLETVVQKLNQERLVHVVETAGILGIKHVTMSNIFFVSCGGGSNNIPAQKTRDIGHKLYRIDINTVYRQLAECRDLARRHGIAFSCRMNTKEDIENIYYNGRFSFVRRCLYPWLMCRVNPYGDVIPCTGSTLSMGNVLNEKFAEIWNGKEYCGYRRQLKEAGLFPECVKCNTLSNERWEEWNHIKER